MSAVLRLRIPAYLLGKPWFCLRLPAKCRARAPLNQTTDVAISEESAPELMSPLLLHNLAESLLCITWVKRGHGEDIQKRAGQGSWEPMVSLKNQFTNGYLINRTTKLSAKGPGSSCEVTQEPTIFFSVLFCLSSVYLIMATVHVTEHSPGTQHCANCFMWTV